MPWIIAGGAVLGGALGFLGADKASDAQKDAAGKSVAEQQRQYNIGLNLLEPSRALGYGAMSDLAALYGYNLPQYQSANTLLQGGYGSTGGVQGVGPSGGLLSNIGGLFGGRRDPRVSIKGGLVYFDGRKSGGTLHGGHINPQTGEVWVDGPNGTKDEALSAQATAALRSGQPLTGGVWARFNLGMSQLQKSGWSYDPEAIARSQADANLNPASGQPGDMSRFFASPDYQFRRDEGQRDIGSSFAARGGAASGNALRALSQFNSNLASGEYGNYVNRLFNMAGMGQTATAQGVNSGQNYANQYSTAQQNAGDARASGIMGGVNAINGAINNGLNAWAWNRYMQQQPAQQPGPWRTGYVFGG